MNQKHWNNPFSKEYETLITVDFNCPHCKQHIRAVCPPKLVDHEKLIKHWNQMLRKVERQNFELRLVIQQLTKAPQNP